jgi:hypothetical protein
MSKWALPPRAPLTSSLCLAATALQRVRRRPGAGGQSGDAAIDRFTRAGRRGRAGDAPCAVQRGVLYTYIRSYINI